MNSQKPGRDFRHKFFPPMFFVVLNLRPPIFVIQQILCTGYQRHINVVSIFQSFNNFLFILQNYSYSFIVIQFIVMTFMAQVLMKSTCFIRNTVSLLGKKPSGLLFILLYCCSSLWLTFRGWELQTFLEILIGGRYSPHEEIVQNSPEQSEFAFVLVKF